MSKITEFEIEEGIIHILDINGDEPLLNDVCIDLSREEINLFLTKHVEKILKDEELNFGKFYQNPKFLDDINLFFLGEKNLIDISKDISKEFFELIGNISNVPSCDLLFLKLKTELGYSLCILKLDYIKSYIHKIDYVENKMKIDIIPQYIALPNASQKVMKACFFFEESHMDYEILYLDKSYRTLSENLNFFKEDFLKVSRVYSNYSKTKDLITVTEKWTRKNIKDDADKAYSVREAFRDKLENEETLSVSALARHIFSGNENEIENFVDFVSSNGLEGEINVHKEYIDKKYERIRLKVDKDIDLYINKESYYDINRFEVKKNGDGSLTMVIKYIMNYHEK